MMVNVPYVLGLHSLSVLSQSALNLKPTAFSIHDCHEYFSTIVPLIIPPTEDIVPGYRVTLERKRYFELVMNVLRKKI